MRFDSTILCFLLGAGFVHAGPPLLTDDPDTPERGHWEINLAATAEKRSDVWSLESPLLDFNYGLRDNVQLKFEVPYLIEAQEGGKDQTGIGDSELGVKWRFLDQEKCGVSVSTYPQFAFNNSNHAVRRGLVEDGWQFILPVEVSRELDDKTVVFGEVGFTWGEEGEEGALWGIACERELCEKFSLLGEIYGQCGSDFGNQELLCNLGFHWQTCEHSALIGSIGRGLTESDEPEAKVLGYLGVQLTF